jgi:hypothetical protein
MFSTTPPILVHYYPNLNLNCQDSFPTKSTSLLRKLLLNMSNRLPRIQMLWANLGAVHNCVTPVQLERIIQLG